jgi:AbrB family looped-hinge helix DNA binding protein
MPLAQSKLTAQSQISVPAEVRRRLGLGPGSVIAWEARGDDVVVRRAGRSDSAAVHAALFPEGKAPAGSSDVKAGIKTYLRRKHARG